MDNQEACSLFLLVFVGCLGVSRWVFPAGWFRWVFPLGISVVSVGCFRWMFLGYVCPVGCWVFPLVFPLVFGVCCGFVVKQS